MPIAILISALFLAIVAMVSCIGYFVYARSGRLLEQLADDPGELMVLAPRLEGKRESSLAAIFSAIGNVLPLTGADFRIAKKELTAAGFRSDAAVKVLQGVKLFLVPALALAAFSIKHSIPNPILGLVLVAASGFAGYYGPSLVVDILASKRQKAIRLALPDALDLLVVCSEAGIGLDQGLQTVSRELKNVHKALSEEFTLMNLEMLAGVTRQDALRQLAARTGEPELRKLVAVLVQTDRFGTSIAEALRTQSDALRIRRRQEAEERAGKLGVKLVFPIFFFCLPALVILVAGPGILMLFKNLFPAMKSMH